MTGGDGIGGGIGMGPCTPFFISRDVASARAFYVDRLGFGCRFEAPGFVIVGRGMAQIMLKEIGPEVAPLPNPARHPWARWDTFVLAAEPDALAREFAARGVAFAEPLADTDEGLRGFAVADPDGHVCFFGHPREG